MKNEISAGTEEVIDRRITIEDLNPTSLKKIDKNGNVSKKFVQIKNFFKSHALCRVNGRFNECFTYGDLASMAAVQEEKT